MRAQSVESCIYCGATDDLTDEHIIPLALGGNYVLPNASCVNCAKITAAFERRVLRGFMLDGRTAAAYPTRRPRERPLFLPLRVERGEIVEEINIPPQEHPGFLFLPRLERPSALTGRQAKTGVSVCGVEILSFGKSPSEVVQDLGVKTIEVTANCDVPSFARLLAKIGYSYAVASVGLLPREDVTVLPLILGEADDASVWLGSAQFELTAGTNNSLHALAHESIHDPKDNTSRLLLVRVKLFVPSNATGYEIVVCRTIGAN
jgi:HNH endonuclease